MVVVFFYMCAGLSFVKLHFMYLWMDTSLVRIKLKAAKGMKMWDKQNWIEIYTAPSAV